MTGPLILIAGAAAFFAGFLTGVYLKAPGRRPPKQNSTPHRAGDVIRREEYHNLLTYDGTAAE